MRFIIKYIDKRRCICQFQIMIMLRTYQEIDNYLKAFNTFEKPANDDYDWEGAGIILQTMRSNGFQVPFADAVIAFIAMKYDIPLWTRDTHFLLIQGYYPELKLYESI